MDNFARGNGKYVEMNKRRWRVVRQTVVGVEGEVQKCHTLPHAWAGDTSSLLPWKMYFNGFEVVEVEFSSWIMKSL